MGHVRAVPFSAARVRMRLSRPGFSVALGSAPIAAAVAFIVSAQAHSIDFVVAQSICGNPSMSGATTIWLGHCASCWLSAAAAAVAACVASAAWGGAVTLGPRVQAARVRAA